MLSPEILYTLYILAKRGAVYHRCNLTTGELGAILGVSQQTASRRITECEREGLIRRFHTPEGTSLQLTEKGQSHLRNVLTELQIAFSPPSEKIVIEGIVTDGLGEGAYYVEVYATRFQEALGFRPFAGTLNVRIFREDSRNALVTMKNTPPLVVRGFSSEGRTFGDVICYRVRIQEQIEGAVVIAQRTHHDKDVLEIIAPVNIRTTLGLKNNDMVRLEVIPLHMVT